MPYAFPDNIPKVAKNWTPEQQKKCIAAANAVLSDDGSEQDAVFACIRAAGKTEHPGGEGNASTPWVDLFDAGRVLAGEEVLLVPLMPDGYVRGGIRRPPITAQDLQLMESNFQNRAMSGFYQTRVPVNKEHEATEGKIGTVRSFRVADDGGYASFDLTPEGRSLLESGKFDYLSPEIRWNTTDTVTGAELGPSLAGVAVTNYPYFGDRTAMYSERAEQRLTGELGAPLPDTFGEAGDDGEPATGFVAEIQAAFRAFTKVLSRAISRSGVEPDTFAQTLMTALAQEQAGDSPEDSVGGTDMNAPNSGDGTLQVPEEFTSQLRALESQAEQFRAQIAERDQTIASQGARLDRLMQERMSERFSREAEAFSAIGAERDEFATNLQWLFTADTTETREHYTWFSALLTSVNSALADSAAFSEVGHSREAPGGSDPWRQIDAVVQNLARERGIVVREGTAEYASLMSEVSIARPDLFSAYRRSLVGQ